MDTNIDGCCNSNSDFIQTCSDDINDQDNYNSPINKTLRKMEKDICAMKVTLAETEATLLFLAQTMCNRGFLCDIENTLLCNLENGIKNLEREVNDTSNNLDYLDCLLY